MYIYVLSTMYIMYYVYVIFELYNCIYVEKSAMPVSPCPNGQQAKRNALMYGSNNIPSPSKTYPEHLPGPS